MITSIITTEDDLIKLVDEINQAFWDDANDMSAFDVETLSAYLVRQDTLFVACHEIVENSKILLGIAYSRVEIKPYGKVRWLYVDEVDVCANQRRKGAGKAIMQKLLEIAKEKGCEEVWLGTELENTPAKALYQSLEPDEVAQFVGYSYETDE